MFGFEVVREGFMGMKFVLDRRIRSVSHGHFCPYYTAWLLHFALAFVRTGWLSAEAREKCLQTRLVSRFLT